MAEPVILCDTKGMTNEEWLKVRMHGPKGNIPYTVGGSDVAAIFGVSPWTSPLELWLIKKGRMKPKEKENAAQLRMGTFWNLLLHTGIRPKPATWCRMIPICINTRIILMPLPILTDDTAVLQMESLAY